MATVAEMLEAKRVKTEQGPWFPACGGTEVPFFARTGKRLLYCFQPSTGKHAYLDMGSDMFLSAEEAAVALGVM